MPRADRRRSFASRPRLTGRQRLGRVGVRAIDCVRPDGVTVETVAVNPGEWRCSGLMADLLDGWVAHRSAGVDSRYARFKTAQADRYALDDFARFVDGHAVDPVALRLADVSLDLVSDWEADLAARFFVDGSGQRKVSNEPHVRAAKLLAFIRKAAAIGVVVDPIVWIGRGMGLDRDGTAMLPARSWGSLTRRIGLSGRLCSPCSIGRWRRFARAQP